MYAHNYSRWRKHLYTANATAKCSTIGLISLSFRWGNLNNLNNLQPHANTVAKNDNWSRRRRPWRWTLGRAILTQQDRRARSLVPTLRALTELKGLNKGYARVSEIICE